MSLQMALPIKAEGGAMPDLSSAQRHALRAALDFLEDAEKAEQEAVEAEREAVEAEETEQDALEAERAEEEKLQIEVELDALFTETKE
jgi:hypothetical protein